MARSTLLATMLFGLVACGNDSKPVGETPTTPDQVTQDQAADGSPADDSAGEAGSGPDSATTAPGEGGAEDEGGEGGNADSVDAEGSLSGEIGKADRAVLFINSSLYCDGHSSGMTYQLIDNGAHGLFASKLSAQYGVAKELRGKDATVKAVLAALRDLTEQDGIKVIDTMVNLHGGEKGEICFADRMVPADEFGDMAVAAGIKSDKLRILYSMSCHGRTQIDGYRKIGFRAVNGAVGINSNGMIEYPSFLIHWAKGESFETTLEKAAKGEGLSGIWLTVANLLGIGTDSASKKIIEGDGSLGINSAI